MPKSRVPGNQCWDFRHVRGRLRAEDGGRHSCAPQFSSAHSGVNSAASGEEAVQIRQGCQAPIVGSCGSSYLCVCIRMWKEQAPPSTCFTFVIGAVSKCEAALWRLCFGIHCVVTLVTEQAGAAA